MTELSESERLSQEKERLIRSWMGLQDQAELLNEQILHLSYEIETLNCRIAAAVEAERSAAKGGNGVTKEAGTAQTEPKRSARSTSR